MLMYAQKSYIIKRIKSKPPPDVIAGSEVKVSKNTKLKGITPNTQKLKHINIFTSRMH